jgi:hypothetical protein
MATARPVGTVRRSTGTGGRPAPASAEIPPARWAGVALVIAALLGTILLGMLSPGEGGSPELAVGAPTETTVPVASLVPNDDPRIPRSRPVISAPQAETVSREWTIGVTVDVPQEKLPAKILDLVIYRDGEEVRRVERPGRGKPVTVGVLLEPGRNELTAALASPGGVGPTSEPAVVHHDSDAPELVIKAPQDGLETLENSIALAIESEPGATVVVRNEANDRHMTETVGPSGTVSMSMKLDKGRNRISVTSTDDAGKRQDELVVVQRRDGHPKLELSVPKQVRRADLPRRLRVAVVVKDWAGKPIPNATVNFSLLGLGRETESNVDTTDASGRAEWRPELTGGSSEPVRLTVEVEANGFSSSDFREIRIS